MNIITAVVNMIIITSKHSVSSIIIVAVNFRGRKFSLMREMEDFANNIFANQHYCPIFVNKNKKFADNISRIIACIS